MKRVGIKRPESDPPAVARQAEQAARRQMAWAAGAEAFRNRDPVGYVTESFRQTFDAAVRRSAYGRQESDAGTRRGAPPPERAEARYPDPTSARSFYERGGPEDQDMLRRFSETALERGTLSGAVLRGSGRMMLFSCLKKTVGQSQPVRWQQRKLFEKASQQRNVPGHGPDQVVFNRGFTDSAVALVVDALKDARRTVESLEDLIRGKSGMGASGGAQTLRAMYPFLDDSRERALLIEYRERLRGAEGADPARGILTNAAGRAAALIAKKAQMRAEFISKLRFLSDRANEALAEWEQPEFDFALYTALRRAVLPPEPPEDGGDEDGPTTPDAGPPGDGAEPKDGAEPPTQD